MTYFIVNCPIGKVLPWSLDEGQLELGTIIHVSAESLADISPSSFSWRSACLQPQASDKLGEHVAQG